MGISTDCCGCAIVCCAIAGAATKDERLAAIATGNRLAENLLSSELSDMAEEEIRGLIPLMYLSAPVLFQYIVYSVAALCHPLRLSLARLRRQRRASINHGKTR